MKDLSCLVVILEIYGVNNMNIKKLRGDYCLIRPDGEEKTTSGILLSKKPEQGDFMNGVVIWVGDWRDIRKDDPVNFVADLKEGDKVTFQYGVPMKVGDEMLMLVNESDIKLILE